MKNSALLKNTLIYSATSAISLCMTIEDTQPYCKACRTELNTSISRGHSDGYDMIPCPSCSTVTVHPFPTVEQLIEYYQAYEGSTDYRAKQDKKIRRAHNRIKRLQKFTDGTRFLDVGCNHGFTVEAATRLGFNAHGIDIDKEAVISSQQTFGADRYTSIAVQDYAAAGNKADIIYTSEVIEHVPDPDSFVKAIAEILDVGGILYLTTPDSGHFRVPKNFVEWNDVMPPEHITYFTKEGLRILLKKYGLEIQKFHWNLKPGLKLVAKKIV